MAAKKKAKPAKKAARKTAGKKKAAKKKSSRKTVKKPMAKAPARKAAAKRPARKTAPRKARTVRKQIVGEGDYAASRAFLKDQEGFVRKNRAKIPELGKDARAALEGSEGPSLLAAEAEARGHARGQTDDER